MGGEVFAEAVCDEAADRNPMHVVGVGASAGGLEALESLFERMPADTGMAFVVVQHLSPDFKSHMGELLARKTSMRVQSVEDGVTVEPNTVYLIPPKKTMIMSEGRLLLTDREPGPAGTLPIDQFLRSLAADVGNRSIAIILSGTGSDGSRGVRHVHEAGGLVLCQDEQSARFDGMPLNAQETGLVHMTLTPAAMPDALVRYVRENLLPDRLAEQELVSGDRNLLDRLFKALRKEFGVDFSLYKATTVGRRIDRRLELTRSSSLEDYVELVEQSPAELDHLYCDLLIGVTRFFRDAEAFDRLKLEIDQIILKHKSDEQVRVWVAGCATGEEAYSVAMLFAEAIAASKRQLSVKVFATDVHRPSLHIAGLGRYPEEAMAEVSRDRRERFFRQDDEGYLVGSELRQLVVFAQHNVVNDAPFTRLDLITCRNLLIYLQPAAQKKVLSLFHFGLKLGGRLFLGPSEGTGDVEPEFEAIDKNWRLYRKRRDVRLLYTDYRLPQSTSVLLEKTGASRGGRESRLGEHNLLGTYDRLLQEFMPPSILIDDRGDVLHTFGGAERFLRIPGGRPTTNLLDLIEEGIRPPVAGALQHVRKEMASVRYTGLAVTTADGLESFRLHVMPLHEGRTNTLRMLVQFEPVEDAPAADAAAEVEVNTTAANREQIKALEAELRYTKENLQATIEELETSNEELQATNEELVASNEELQSTNEELHSVNEELYTVNSEHQKKIQELIELTDDIDNLLIATEVGVVFLDANLRIRRYTPQMASAFNFLPQDLGRTIHTFTSKLDHPALEQDLQTVLSGGRVEDREVSDREGGRYLLRILPYRTNSDIEGVVVTLIDVRSLKRAERELERFRFCNEQAADGHLIVCLDGTVDYVNKAFAQLLDRQQRDLLDTPLSTIVPELTQDRLRDLLDDARQGALAPFEVTLPQEKGPPIPLEVSGARLAIDGEDLLFLETRDSRHRKWVEQERRRATERAELALSAGGMGAWEWDVATGEMIWSDRQYELLGLEPGTPATVDRLLACIHPDDREDVARGLECVMDAPDEELIQEFRVCLDDGSLRWIALKGRASRDAFGEITRVYGINRDITAEKTDREELASAKALAELTTRAKSEFLAHVSHEVRTPLTAILGYADIVSDLPDLLPAVAEPVAIIQRNGLHLLDLVNDLLDLSKVEAGKLAVRPMLFSPEDMLADLRKLIEVRAREKTLKFEVVQQGDVPVCVQADEVRMRQILVNLVSNAVKFTEQGSVRVELSHRSAAGRHQLRWVVRDTGRGMSESFQRDLFAPFTQEAPVFNKESRGTGLGLAITKRLVELLRGTIAVSSQLGEGTLFTVELPVEVPEGTPQKPAAKVVEPGADGSDVFSTQLSMLVVDDHEEICHLTGELLSQAGATVVKVMSGREALDVIRERLANGRPFDAIVMDMHMPVLDGYQVTSQLRADGYTGAVVALTAAGMPADRERCLAAGCDEYLAKPADRRQLVRAVEQALRRRRVVAADEPRSENGQPRCRVLVVDDNHDLCSLTETYLGGMGHEVSTATSGAQAIEMAKARTPDLAIIDNRLGDMDGVGLIRQLRALPGLASTQFIAMTGDSDDGVVRRLESSGCAEVLIKPVDPEALHESVNRLHHNSLARRP